MVIAGLEVEIDRRAFGGDALQRDRLGVRPARVFVPAFADDLAVTNQHAADTRIGRGRPQATLRQLFGKCDTIFHNLPL